MNKTEDKKIQISKELEKQYKNDVKEMNKLVDKQIKIARKAIKQIENLSEQYGLPVYSPITPLLMQYRPESKSEIWAELLEEIQSYIEDEDNEDYDDVEDKYRDLLYGEGDGWEHSAVCW